MHKASSRIHDQMVCDVLAGGAGSFLHVPGASSRPESGPYQVCGISVRCSDWSGQLHATAKATEKAPSGSQVHAGKQRSKEEAKRSQAPSPSTKSLSVLDMLKLGREIHDTQSAESVDLFQFDMNHMAWSLKPLKVEFTVEKEPFGKGGFREAFKASRKTAGFVGQKWVIKNTSRQP